MDTITIRKQEYFELKLADATLGALLAGGVDNWSGYSDALWPWYLEDIDVIEARLRKEILGEEPTD